MIWPKIEVKGFSLPELLAVLAVLSISLAIAIPGFGALAESSNLRNGANEFASALGLARSEAIKRRVRAVLCKSINGETCVSTGGWSQGWIVFSDTNNNSLRDSTETVILHHGALPVNYNMTGNSSVANYVSYMPTGTTKMVSGAFQAGTITLCKGTGAAKARQIIISSTGRYRIGSKQIGACPKA